MTGVEEWRYAFSERIANEINGEYLRGTSRAGTCTARLIRAGIRFNSTGQLIEITLSENTKPLLAI